MEQSKGGPLIKVILVSMEFQKKESSIFDFTSRFLAYSIPSPEGNFSSRAVRFGGTSHSFIANSVCRWITYFRSTPVQDDGNR